MPITFQMLEEENRGLRHRIYNLEEFAESIAAVLGRYLITPESLDQYEEFMCEILRAAHKASGTYALRGYADEARERALSDGDPGFELARREEVDARIKERV